MKKIILIIGILLLITGAAYAANNNEIFKAPSNLHAMGHDDFVDEKGHNIMIMEDTADNHKTWFENDTETNYIVEKYNESFYIAADDKNDCYILEVVENGGTKYIVASWTPKGTGETQTILSNMLEFNKLNNLKPVEV